MSTKEVFAQEVITHEVFYNFSKLLDQMCNGMKRLPIFDVIQSFPHLFTSLFTYSGNVSVDDVLDAVYFPDMTELTSRDEVTVKFIYRYLRECNHEGKICTWQTSTTVPLCMYSSRTT